MKTESQFQLMPQAQESTPSADPSLWTVEDGEALRLSIGPGLREVHVTEGRLWLTREGTAEQPAEDLWLSPGEAVALASGSEWVVEAWGTTRFQLLVPPRACSQSPQSRAHAGGALSAGSWVSRVSSSLLQPALG
jgi:hypothetical protein